MATRIEKPVAGETYWDSEGDRCTVEFISRRGDAFGYYEDVNCPSNWRASDGTWPLYATDPTKPEPAPIDLTRRWKMATGNQVHGLVKMADGRISGDIEHNRNEWAKGYWESDGSDRYDPRCNLVPDDDLPALDLTKPVKFANGGGKPAEVASHVNGRIFYRVNTGGCAAFCDADGRLAGIPVLVQCTRRDWTQADVPYPWPVFRVSVSGERSNLYQPMIIRSDGIRFCDIGIARWPELARDWEYTVDGKTWNRCEVWE